MKLSMNKIIYCLLKSFIAHHVPLKKLRNNFSFILLNKVCLLGGAVSCC